MGLIKDRHGTYYARHKVPERLQEAVARILDNGKARQVWLKKSLGTKVVAQANVRAKPVQIEFDQLLAKAEAQLKERPLRSSLADVEIKRIADFFLASALAVDEQRRITGKGDDPLFVSVDARCAMHHHVDPAEALEGRVHRRLNLWAIVQVRRQHGHVVAFGPHFEATAIGNTGTAQTVFGSGFQNQTRQQFMPALVYTNRDFTLSASGSFSQYLGATYIRNFQGNNVALTLTTRL